MNDVMPVAMSRADAERLTERIRLTATTFIETKEKLTQLIHEAQQGKAHEALGYRSWTEYVSQVFSDTPLMRLSRDERKELVGELASQGMSTRAIAPVVGTNYSTVSRDLKESVANATDQPRMVQSNDGITRTFHPRPEPDVWEEPADVTPPKPKRAPLPQQFLNTIVELQRVTSKLERLIEDDKFDRNKKEIATLYSSDLERASATIHNALEALNK